MKAYNLSGIQPCHSQPSDGEEGVEDEQEGRSYNTRCSASNLGHHSQDDHRKGLTNSTKQHQLAAADLLDDQNSDPRGEEVFRSVGCSKDTGDKSSQTDFVLVNRGGIVGDKVDS